MESPGAQGRWFESLLPLTQSWLWPHAAPWGLTWAGLAYSEMLRTTHLWPGLPPPHPPEADTAHQQGTWTDTWTEPELLCPRKESTSSSFTNILLTDLLENSEDVAWETGPTHPGKALTGMYPRCLGRLQCEQSGIHRFTGPGLLEDVTYPSYWSVT